MLRRPRAVPLKVLGDVEAAVHPAVALQHGLTDTTSGLKLGPFITVHFSIKTAHQIAFDGVAEELITRDEDGRRDEDDHRAVRKQ